MQKLQLAGLNFKTKDKQKFIFGHQYFHAIHVLRVNFWKTKTFLVCGQLKAISMLVFFKGPLCLVSPLVYVRLNLFTRSDFKVRSQLFKIYSDGSYLEMSICASHNQNFEEKITL